MLFFAAVSFFAVGVLGNSRCKTTPLDAEWPAESDWVALNFSVNDTLIKTAPAASSCYPGNPFNSTYSCDPVEANWTLATFQASTPEGVDYMYFANDSCIPPTDSAFVESKGCEVGGAPLYVLNATTEEQISVALTWAASRDIRVVVKGTGHDMNGRSSGAYALSIWTHNFRTLEFNSSWTLPDNSGTEEVFIAGSGNIWFDVYSYAISLGKTVVGGGAKDVGLGGFLQGGGHGPFSSHYGLGSDQILQVTIVTTVGDIFVANSQQNQDLFWAVKGGQAGNYGVVTEYVLKAYPAPSSVVKGTLSLSAAHTDNASIAANWNAFSVLQMSLPDLMDAGLTGSSISFTDPSTGAVSVAHTFFGYNLTNDEFTALIQPVADSMQAQGPNGSLTVTWGEPSNYTNFISFFESTNPDPSPAGGGSLMCSRLLGRPHLSEKPVEEVASYLQRIMVSEDPTVRGLLVTGMQGGQGPANVPENMRGALLPAWRSSYLHVIAFGATIDANATAQDALTAAGEWMNRYKEPIWQEWAPDSGSYMNEANCYNINFKNDFYGANYDRLLEIKQKYDPSKSLFVLTGVGSDHWDYNLNTGKLCQTA